ncbi:Ankyrin repeat-containing protein [Lasiodiplodia hormozganensis]|uniref:Ankyrin repeat-containing protein n=1 Tax=Lasiodiplodia hormozganensis TaxID=869390 RepID=A0AA40CHL2_9PEZI|nr:Ankyrin repeat-containing protein [Lasiodiplodia hormozganensis]
MGIHEDARNGTLMEAVLDDYVKRDPNLLDERDPETGLTPLAAATMKGHVKEVEQLLRKCARADATSKNGETPLLTATRNPIMNRPRIIQLLLRKTPPCFVDATCGDADNNTPLMFAIKQNDLESIRLLRNAGASLTRRNDDGLSAKDLVDSIEDKAVKCALYPDKEQSDLMKLGKLVLHLLFLIITWVNQVTGAICRMYPEMNQVFKELVTSAIFEPRNAESSCDIPDYDICIGERSSPDSFEELRKVGNVGKDPTLERFYEGKTEYMKGVTEKVKYLKKDESTSLSSEDLLPKVIQVSLHRQVVYCDDSSSMGRDAHVPQKSLWGCQKELVEHITQITTRILPEGEGVVLKFINQDIGSSDLTVAEISDKLGKMSPITDSRHSEIGTFLRSKILEPLVYSKIKTRSLERPLLISVITDGRPTNENQSTLVDAILECGQKLEKARYRREDVKFMIGQIGASQGATGFLDSIRRNREISRVVYCTTDRLDIKFAEFHENKKGLDRWLIETLHKPIEASSKPIKDLEQ